MRDDANAAAFLLAGKTPDAIALRTLTGDRTYGELTRAVAQVAAHLVETEPRGSRVLLIAENSLFWAAAYLGVLRAGMVCVPLPPTIAAADLSYILRLTDARLAFVQARVLAGRGAEFAGVRVISEPLPSAASEILFPPVAANDLAALMFTSGSTGRPRGVMVSHGNIRANTESIVEYLGLTADDRMMTVLPFHYCFGTSLLHTHLRAGASLVLDSRFLYPETVLQHMTDAGCTGFAGVPSHFQILLRHSSLKTRAFPRLRHVQQAGGHLAPAFVRELREALPHARVFIMYGQTEATARLSYLPPEFLDSKPGSIGKGMPGVTLKALNAAGKEVAPGEAGEIVAEGANVALGYWGAPEESAKCFRDGKLYTGDIATVDEEGFLYILDRGKDFLKCGGVRVSCRQLEQRLLEGEGLAEAAVVGISDEILGEAVKAVVVGDNGAHCDGQCDWTLCSAARERVLRYCKEHMAPQVVPREIVFIPELPMNSAGKVDKTRLKDLLFANRECRRLSG